MKNAKDNALTTSMDRLNGLIAWWGIQTANGNGAINRHILRLQQFAADLQEAGSDAYSVEMDAALSGNDRLGRSIQELLRCRRPRDLLAAESEIVATLLDSASLQAKRWAELTQKLQDCCAAMARDVAADLRREAEETVPAGADGAPEVNAAKALGRRAG